MGKSHFSSFLIITLVFIGGMQSNTLEAQRYVTTFGVQFKPILYDAFFRTKTIDATANDLSLEISPKSGNVFGMVVRRGLSDFWSFETGINLVTRHYSMRASILDTNLFLEDDFQLLSYDIPVQALIYVRLGEKLFLNASGGFSFGLFPSDVQTFNENLEHTTRRRRLISASLLSNVGFEYRTKKSGYFYLGMSYLLPLNDPFVNNVYAYNRTSLKSREMGVLGLQTNYVTLDLRYFFHEEPNEMTRKKIKERDDRRQKRLFELGFDVEDPDAKKKFRLFKKRKKR